MPKAGVSELYQGHDRTLAAEFGHMSIDPHGLPCTCGRCGCWELYVSDQATFRRYRPEIRLTDSRFQQFLTATQENEPQALAALEETSRYLALGIANIGFILNPDLIILAGRICGAWHTLSRAIGRALAPAPLHVSFRQAALPADQLFLSGAIHLALSRVFSRRERE